MEPDTQIVVEMAPDVPFTPFAQRIGDDLYYIGLDASPGAPALKLSRKQILRLMKVMIDLIHENWFAV